MKAILRLLNGNMDKLKIHFSSDSQEWATPFDIFEKYNNKYNFDIDLAASKTNHKVDKYFSIDDDALLQDWTQYKSCWLNPPYKGIDKWIKKCYESTKDSETIIVCLIPARTDTRYWHDYIFPNAKIEFLKGRIKFLDQNGNKQNSAPFPSAIVTFGEVKNG